MYRVVCEEPICAVKPHYGVGVIFPPHCESMQIIPVESLPLKRLFYLKGLEKKREREINTRNRRARANCIRKALFRIRDIYRAEIATGHAKMLTTPRYDVEVYIVIV